MIDAVRQANATLEERSGVRPGLAVIIVGDVPASHAYVNSKADCQAMRLQIRTVHIGCGNQPEGLGALVASLNVDPSIHGILVQLPKPKPLNSGPIIRSILPEKDVDGLHVVNAGKLTTGDLETGLVSCTPAGAMVFVRRTMGRIFQASTPSSLVARTCSANRWRSDC
ncbi:tetrahydrofolate dehydrogenase/cyclohydrolase catalytic domain-containing protein [Agrobacterium tumefaciens]|nr:tetrahydrofolate dehydrogenase/cyclohydrolase catalytic domain-containing protein [Agrobacterium tumefaciens]WCK05573.1 tetrahydrofolate dehydrogenase/cyclohydrolase catalytic domain-containing protein [Agrobacterium tumefaciens]